MGLFAYLANSFDLHRAQLARTLSNGYWLFQVNFRPS